MLIGYAAGPFWGIRWATAIYLALGWVGAFFYSSLCFPQRLQRGLAASLFIGNGFFICRIAYGHIDFIPFLLLPGVLYLLHRSVEWSRPSRSGLPMIRLATSTLALAAVLATTVDGSPVSILHELFWIVLYGGVLAIVTRSFAPVLLLATAIGMASILDAGYLWPMIAGQTEAPRKTADAFTHPLALPWYMIVPVWGRFFLPTNGKGHEFSVFIGPVLAVFAWVYRRSLWQSLPRSQKLPLLVVVLLSIWLGMGSLRDLHVPRWLSPFDLLRPLPGFRSIGVTGRYWGFLALPLSLLCAGGLWAFVSFRRSRFVTALGVGLALLTQLGFQTSGLLSKVVPGRVYHPIEWKESSKRGGTLDFVERGEHLQGELISPARAVIDCYDEDEIPRAEMTPGNRLLRSADRPGREGSGVPSLRACFATWNRIRVQFEEPPDDLPAPATGSMAEIVLNQAYHRSWSATDGQVAKSASGNLVLKCDESRLRGGPVELHFNDPLSSLGWDVSIAAWVAWLGALTGLLVAGEFSRRSLLREVAEEAWRDRLETLPAQKSPTLS
jgi:hypothetical protein